MNQDSILLVTAISLAVVAFVLAISAHRRLSSARRSLALLQGTFQGATLIDAVADYAEKVGLVEGDIQALSARQDELLARLARSAGNIGVVRYDAFEDMGGQMSFSAALLNDQGDGVVFTSINGRAEARTYAKVIEGTVSDHNLSPEEQRAISEALRRRTRVRR